MLKSQSGLLEDVSVGGYLIPEWEEEVESFGHVTAGNTQGFWLLSAVSQKMKR